MKGLIVLDAVDTALVKALQGDGRATYQTLADGVGLSRTAVRARIRHLLGVGAIRIVGVLHADVTGTQVFGHVLFRVAGPVKPVAVEIARRNSVTFAAQTTGRCPLVAHVRVGDDVELSAELAKLRRIPGVAAVEVFRGGRIAKDTCASVRTLRDTQIDPIDWRLIRHLQRDGRASYAQLARSIGLSQAAARARAVRLIDSGIIHVTALMEPSAMGVREQLGFAVCCRGDAEQLASWLSTVPGVSFVTSGFGRFDILGEVVASDRAALVETLETIRSAADVAEVETWEYLRVVKEERQGGEPAVSPNGQVKRR